MSRTDKNTTYLQKMAQRVHSVEKILGHLTMGQRSDLLMDNFSDLIDSSHAKVRPRQRTKEFSSPMPTNRDTNKRTIHPMSNRSMGPSIPKVQTISYYGTAKDDPRTMGEILHNTMSPTTQWCGEPKSIKGMYEGAALLMAKQLLKDYLEN